MADNLRKRGSPDTKTINMSEKWERDYWKKKLDITGQALAAAVDKAGKSVEKVKQYVKIKKKIGHY
jgi:Protein of unknown function (DUF3606)